MIEILKDLGAVFQSPQRLWRLASPKPALQGIACLYNLHMTSVTGCCVRVRVSLLFYTSPIPLKSQVF